MNSALEHYNLETNLIACQDMIPTYHFNTKSRWCVNETPVVLSPNDPALQAGAYYMGMLAYYWVLATPAVGFLFGCYLYIAVNWFHVHYDEAFSALRIPNFKGFSRLHINTDGDLEIYGLAMDKVKPYALP